MEIWGAGDLADKIFDISITNTSFKDKISKYLPAFHRELETYADYGDTPYELDDNYIRNQDFINEIDSTSSNKHICVITGISGIVSNLVRNFVSEKSHKSIMLR